MKVVLISDTHGEHLNMLPLPAGDLIIHAGDFCKVRKHTKGTQDSIDFLDWFSKLPFKHKVCIQGNHDNDINGILPSNVRYLNDSSITIEGYKIWGSNIRALFNWDVKVKKDGKIHEQEEQKHWNRERCSLIPLDTDILITHGPAYKQVDLNTVNVGCKDILEAVNNIKPILHVCGHVHQAYGYSVNGCTTHVNASVCNQFYIPINKPILLELVDREVKIK